MRRVLLLGVAVMALGCGGSSSSTTGPSTKDAIKRVYEADKQLMQQRQSLPPRSSPSQMAWAVGHYCDGLEKLPMGDCPAEFQVAYKQHARAWREMQATLAALPDDFVSEFFTAMGNRFMGEMDGGIGRQKAELKASSTRVRTSWEEVEKIGAKYGVAAP